MPPPPPPIKKYTKVQSDCQTFVHIGVYESIEATLELYHSSSSTVGQILPVIRFVWKTVAEMAENKDLGRGPPNITTS